MTNERIIVEKLTGAHPLRKLQEFYKTQQFLPYSQEKVSDTNAEPNESNPHSHPVFIEDLFSHLRLGFPIDVFPIYFRDTSV